MLLAEAYTKFGGFGFLGRFPFVFTYFYAFQALITGMDSLGEGA